MTISPGTLLLLAAIVVLGVLIWAWIQSHNANLSKRIIDAFFGIENHLKELPAALSRSLHPAAPAAAVVDSIVKSEPYIPEPARVPPDKAGSLAAIEAKKAELAQRFDALKATIAQPKDEPPVRLPSEPSVPMFDHYIDRDDLMKAAGAQAWSINLDGKTVHNGFGPALDYVTAENGSIERGGNPIKPRQDVTTAAGATLRAGQAVTIDPENVARPASSGAKVMRFNWDAVGPGSTLIEDTQSVVGGLFDNDVLVLAFHTPNAYQAPAAMDGSIRVEPLEGVGPLREFVLSKTAGDFSNTDPGAYRFTDRGVAFPFSVAPGPRRPMNLELDTDYFLNVRSIGGGMTGAPADVRVFIQKPQGL